MALRRAGRHDHSSTRQGIVSTPATPMSAASGRSGRVGEGDVGSSSAAACALARRNYAQVLMPVLLGIDAAWTRHEPSGVSLLSGDDTGGWRCVGLAPSYQAFVDLAAGTPVDWGARPIGGRADVERLLASARELAANSVEVVAIDMPLSALPITGRRTADDCISRRFGGRGASAHSPSVERPGPLSDALRAELAARGFPLATADGPSRTPAVIEVYPHVSLLDLTGEKYRLPYKARKSHKYWPGTSCEERRHLLLQQHESILEHLSRHLDGIRLELPAAADVASFEELKRYEDALESLVCAWSALCYLRGEAHPRGDDTAAIWVPRHQRERSSRKRWDEP